MNDTNPFPSKHISRREFVRASTIVAGTAALAGPFLRSARAGEPGANDNESRFFEGNRGSKSAPWI